MESSRTGFQMLALAAVAALLALGMGLVQAQRARDARTRARRLRADLVAQDLLHSALEEATWELSRR